MKNHTLFLTLALAAAGLPAAQAGTVAYTQSSQFFADLPGFGLQPTETYESYPTNTAIPNGGNPGGGLYSYSGFPAYDDGTVTGRIDDRDQLGANVGFFSVAGGTRSFAAYFTTIPGNVTSGDYFFNGGSFVVTLPAGTQSIGLFFNISAANTPNPDDLFINTAVGNATNGGANYDTTQGNNDGSNGGLGTENLFFLGLISDTPFTSATIGMTEAGAAGWNVDNLTTATTPEPTSLGLLSLGLTALVGSSRRRK